MKIDNIVFEILNILDCQSEFTLDSYSQINGETQSLGIQENRLGTKNFLFEYSDKRILHFTDLNSAYTILKSGKLRSSNLSYFSNKGGDSEEFNHSLNLTHNFNEEYLTLKDNIFISSFTPLENSNLSEYYFHWQYYANNYKGVALEFEITRPTLFPDHFLLEVKYLENIPEKEILLNILKNGQITRQNVYALAPILASIKMHCYQNEKEVRLLSYLDEESYKLRDIKDHYEIGLDSDLNISNRHYYLPFSTPESQLENVLLKLNKIHLGEMSYHNSGAIFIKDFLHPLAEEKEVPLNCV